MEKTSRHGEGLLDQSDPADGRDLTTLMFGVKGAVAFVVLLPIAYAFNFHSVRPFSTEKLSFSGKVLDRACITHGQSPFKTARRPRTVVIRSSLDALSVLSPTFQALSGAVSSFSGVAVLAFVIAFHETGHFLAARLQASERLLRICSESPQRIVPQLQLRHLQSLRTGDPGERFLHRVRPLLDTNYPLGDADRLLKG